MAITPRIVLVDDIKTNLKIYRHALKDEHYTFFSYSDSEEALANISIVQPHLLILDIEMPKLDGIALLKKIRTDLGFKNIPVIFITTLSDESRLNQAFEVGANDILPKEFKPFQLKFKVKTLLDQYFLKQKLMIFGRQMKDKSMENENLIRILCHDLLSPLTAIRLLAIKDKDEKMISIVDNAVSIIEHVREMMALEHGKKQIEPVPTSLIEALKETVETMQIRFEEKEIKYYFDDGFLAEVSVNAERVTLINQVLNNIISNAIKFSKSGGNIFFNLEILNNQVYLKITDEGVGIPQKLVPDIFNKFVKTSRRGTNNEKGTGFGLPIAKTYMNLYGGDIQVYSKCEKEFPDEKSGTTFTLVFNLVEVAGITNAKVEK